MQKILLLITFYFVISGAANAQIIWDAPINIAPASSGNNHPRIVTDAAGNPLVVWYHANRVKFARWDGTAFETPRNINPDGMTVAGASWMGPDIASKGDTVYVVFKQTPEDSGPSWCIHSYDGGSTFSDAVRIDFIEDSLSRFPTVTVDDQGNPIVAFMKFNSSFGDASWAVSRSSDFGNSFSSDVLASGWSSSTSVVCDCCPGAIVSSGDDVVMLYRDNDSNKRDTWAGLSQDGGQTFTSGINVDQQNWMISSCPASGPDGVIIGDTLYSTFMNGASGKTRVYFNRTSLSNFSSGPAVPVTDLLFGLSSQNFPRIAAYGTSMAVIWRQTISGQEQLVLNFSSDITSGLPSLYDTVDLNQIMNSDIAMTDTKIYVVWEDYNSGTIRFRTGTYSNRTAVDDELSPGKIFAYPNPSNDNWHITGEGIKPGMDMKLLNLQGQVLRSFNVNDSNSFSIDNSSLSSGIYFLRIGQGSEEYSIRLLKN